MSPDPPNNQRVLILTRNICYRVEFQNKFYMGDGYRFVPSSYKRLLSGEDEA